CEGCEIASEISFARFVLRTCVACTPRPSLSLTRCACTATTPIRHSRQWGEFHCSSSPGGGPPGKELFSDGSSNNRPSRKRLKASLSGPGGSVGPGRARGTGGAAGGEQPHHQRHTQERGPGQGLRGRGSRARPSVRRRRGLTLLRTLHERGTAQRFAAARWDGHDSRG